MKGLRILLLSRLFWPLVGADVSRSTSLASEFRRRGARVEIATARHHPSWPVEITHREIPVHRIGPSPHTRLGRMRYCRSLRSWLRKRQDAYDVVYALGGPDEILAALSLGRFSRRLLVVAAPRLPVDSSIQTSGRFLQAIADGASAAIVESHDQAARLQEFGLADPRLAVIPPGIESPVVRNSQSRLVARVNLAAIHPWMDLAPATPMAAYIGSLRRDKGIGTLIDAWSFVAQVLPQARLWLVGEGPDAAWLGRRQQRLELNGRVVLTGAFDDVGEVLQAADAVWHPWSAGCPPRGLIEAVASAVPAITTLVAEPELRGLEGLRDRMIMVPSRHPRALADALLRLLGEPQAPSLDFRRSSDLFSMERCGQAHEQLFARLWPPGGR